MIYNLFARQIWKTWPMYPRHIFRTQPTFAIRLPTINPNKYKPPKIESNEFIIDSIYTTSVLTELVQVKIPTKV